MKSFLFFSILLLPFSSLAQRGLSLKMETKPIGSTIRFSQFQGEMIVPLDSLKYDNQPVVNFRVKESFPEGLFLLEIGGLESFKLVLVGNEKIEASLYESGSGMAFRTIGSKENDAFNVLLNLSQNYSRSMDSLSRGMNSLSDFHPRHDAISDSLSVAYHRIAGAYNNSIALIPTLFPTSYAAQVLVPLDKIPVREMKPEWMATFDNDPAFNHVHFLEFVPWHDPRIITNPYLSSKVLEYLYNFTERSEDGIEKAIDRVMTHPEIHPKVEAFLVELLVDFFTEKGVTEFVAYMQEKYLTNCKAPLSPELQAKIEAAVPIANGEAMPNISLPDGDGMLVPLSMMKGDINVIVVWASSCPHCMIELPKLKALYDHLGSKTMNVYAISLDTDQGAWIQAIRQEKLNWINVNDMQGWDSPIVPQIGVSGTPALFLLDENLNLLGRASSFDHLQKIVKEMIEP
jgi:thiol-disulfide isomerase/thioredoxin